MTEAVYDQLAAESRQGLPPGTWEQETTMNDPAFELDLLGLAPPPAPKPKVLQAGPSACPPHQRAMAMGLLRAAV